MATSLSFVGVIWTVVSLCATLLACVGFIMPHWLSAAGDGAVFLRQTSSFGTFRRCGYRYVAVTAAPDDGVQGHFVAECGHYKSFGDIPSVWWQAATVLVGIGCCLSVVVVSAGLLCCCISDGMSRRLGITACLLQLIAGGLMAVGCLLYPLGWNNAQVVQVCTVLARRYSGGSCTIGWAYWATVCGGTTMVVCSWLACFAGKRKGGYQRPGHLARV